MSRFSSFSPSAAAVAAFFSASLPLAGPGSIVWGGRGCASFSGPERFRSALALAQAVRASGFPARLGVAPGGHQVLVSLGWFPAGVRVAPVAACPCCSSFGPRVLGFCLSCGFVRSLAPVLLFVGLVLSSCSHAVVVAQAPCQVLVSEAPQGQVFFSQRVVPGRSVGRSQWFGFQCQFPAWVGSGVAASVAIQGSGAGEAVALPGEYVLQQSAGGWGFWVPVGELPAGWQRVQWVASGQVGAR